jgi:hypothetical protein
MFAVMRIGSKAETPSADLPKRAWGPVSWDSGGDEGMGHRHLVNESNTRDAAPQLRSGISVDVETLMKKLGEIRPNASCLTDWPSDRTCIRCIADNGPKPGVGGWEFGSASAQDRERDMLEYRIYKLDGRNNIAGK